MTAATPLSLPDGAGWFTRMRVALDALRILDKNPADPDAGALYNVCIEHQTFTKLIPRLRTDEDGARLLDERPSLDADDLALDKLEALPEGSLGQTLAAYYVDNGISPFSTSFEVNTDIDYIAKRYRETHDIFHVVTGYGTDVIGEMELQAFAMGNLGLKGPRMILLYSVFALLTRSGQASALQGRLSWRGFYRCVRDAHRAGKALPPMLACRFEDEWETPVADLKARLCPTTSPVGVALLSASPHS